MNSDIPPEIHTLIDVVETMMKIVVWLASSVEGNQCIPNGLYIELLDARTALERLRQQ